VRLDDCLVDEHLWEQLGPVDGPAAFMLYVAGFSHCMRLLTDGLIPAGRALRLAPIADPARSIEQLVAAGLWQAVDGGFEVTDFVRLQRSREQVEKDRDNKRVRQERWLAKRRDVSKDASQGSVRDASQDGLGDGAPALPSPGKAGQGGKRRPGRAAVPKCPHGKAPGRAVDGEPNCPDCKRIWLEQAEPKAAAS
jgi:hypothetical protein